MQANSGGMRPEDPLSQGARPRSGPVSAVLTVAGLQTLRSALVAWRQQVTAPKASRTL